MGIADQLNFLSKMVPKHLPPPLDQEEGVAKMAAFLKGKFRKAAMTIASTEAHGGGEEENPFHYRGKNGRRGSLESVDLSQYYLQKQQEAATATARASVGWSTARPGSSWEQARLEATQEELLETRGLRSMASRLGIAAMKESQRQDTSGRSSEEEGEEGGEEGQVFHLNIDSVGNVDGMQMTGDEAAVASLSGRLSPGLGSEEGTQSGRHDARSILSDDSDDVPTGEEFNRLEQEMASATRHVELEDRGMETDPVIVLGVGESVKAEETEENLHKLLKEVGIH